MIKPSIKCPVTACIAQRRNVLSSLLRPPGGVPLRGKAGDGASADDVDVDVPSSAGPTLTRDSINLPITNPSVIMATVIRIPIISVTVAALGNATVIHPTIGAITAAAIVPVVIAIPAIVIGLRVRSVTVKLLITTIPIAFAAATVGTGITGKAAMIMTTNPFALPDGGWPAPL